MQRTSTAPRKLAPFFNVNESPQGEGGQIDWSRLPADSFNIGKFTVKLAEAVDIGETAVNVDALLYALKKGTVLDFGTVVGQTVTVTASALAAATSITVSALAAPLLDNTLLDFGTNKLARVNGDHAAGATTITVDAIPTALAGNETATVVGGDKVLRLTADAAEGATSITVEPPEFAIADDSEAQADKTGNTDGRLIPAGTIMCRTSAGLMIPRSVGSGSGTEVSTEILRSDAIENSPVAAKSGYGSIKGGGMYENLMPDADSSGDVSSTYKTELNTAGCTFWFTDWSDSRTV